jgi:hypothetical protein
MLYLIVPLLRFYFPRVETTPNRTIATLRGTKWQRDVPVSLGEYVTILRDLIDLPSVIYHNG